MFLYQILFKSYPKKLFLFAFIGLLSGLLNAALFIYINKLIKDIVIDKGSDIRLNTYLFLILFVITIYTRRFLAFSIIKFTQEILYVLKAEMLSKLLKANYSIVKEKRETIFNVLLNDINSISEAGSYISSMLTSSIIVLACFGYMAIISTKLFVISLAVIGIGIVINKSNMKRLSVSFAQVRDLTNQFINYLNQITDGFKEIKVAEEKGKDLYDNFILVNLKKSLSLATKSFSESINSHNIGDILFNMLVGFILIYSRIFMNVKAEEIVSFIFVLLFINGPIQNIVLQIPSLVMINISAKRLTQLNSELESKKILLNLFSENISHKEFKSIKLKNLKYKHISNLSEFEIGPINLELKPGEIIFIKGGNGSGKTTLILCLLGIYKFDSGKITYNDNEHLEKHSTLFSVVFSDFFLFERFYGNYNFDKEKALEYIKLFELDSKVSISDSGFSNINLSMGQRKRLALIQCLLEGRPIIILDEWAADQDPFFRKKFYIEILPFLKQEGKTVFAITHDDKYFHVADKIYEMEFGKLIDKKS